ncbi:MAG TPA: T9SS type A sorting domain-containing protein [Catalimonadaceae bacterium]|nr:T9SS type A sorting domain-containing protein [Catalimonadaceae bacterium]
MYTLFLLAAFPVWAQIPGKLDTTFRTQTNYGPNRPVETIYPIPNGGFLVHAPEVTHFSGKPVSRIFKLNRNGDIDTSFKAPFFTLTYNGFFDMAPCISLGMEFRTSSDGSVYVFSEAEIHVSGVSPHFFRFRPNGQPDTSIHLPGSFLATSRDGGVLSSKGYYFSNGYHGTQIFRVHPDSTQFAPLLLADTGDSYLVSVVPNFKEDIALLFRKKSNGKYHYRRYLPDQKKLSAPQGDFSYTGIQYFAPALLTDDGLIYEYVNTQSIDSISYILRRKPSGEPDSSFHLIPFGALQSFNPEPNGVIRLKRVPVDYSSGDHFEYRYNSAGLFIDSVLVKSGQYRIEMSDTLFQLGLNQQNRWDFKKVGSNGQVFSSQATRSGFNGMVKKLITLPDGKLLAGGSITEYNRHQSPGLIRLLPDGSADTTFRNQALLLTDNAEVTGFQRLANGNILFATRKPAGTNGRYIHRILPDGTLDPDFSPSQLNTFPFQVKEVAASLFMPDGSFWLGLYEESPGFQYLMKFLPNGEPDLQWATSLVQIPGIQYRMELLPVNDSLQIAVTTTQISDPSNEYSAWSAFWFKTFDGNAGLTRASTLVSEFETSPPFRTSQGKLLAGNGGYLARTQSIGAWDSTFTPALWTGEPLGFNRMFPAGALANDEVLVSSAVHPNPSQYMQYVCANSLIFRSTLHKLSRTGILDTAFSAQPITGVDFQILEADSQHVYLYGDLSHYGDRPVNGICRIHNRKSNILLPNKPTIDQRLALNVWPNPAKGTVRFEIPVNGPVCIQLFASNGREVTQQWLKPGASVFSLSGIPKGIYLYRSSSHPELKAGRLVVE